MRRRRFVAIMLLTLALTGTVGAEHVLVAAHQTALDPGFVTGSLAESGAYESASGLGMSYVSAELVTASSPDGEAGDQTGAGATNFVTAAAADAVLDPAYMRSQVEPNVVTTYRYLHGETDEPTVVVDTRPAKSAFVANVEADVANRPLGDLLVALGVDARLTDVGMPVDAETLRRIDGSEAQYEAAQASVRTEVRDQVVTAAVREAMATRSPDELLPLVVTDYDPDAYTDEEKAEMVAANRGEIRTALTADVEADPATDDAVDAALARVNDEGHAAVAVPADVEESLGEDGAASVERLQHLYVDALTGEATHAEFQSGTDAAQANLATALGSQFETRLDSEVPDQMVVSDEFSPETRTALADARQVVTVLDIAAVVLPLVGAVLFAAIWWLAGALEVALFTTGSASLFVGGLSYAAALRASVEARSFLTMLPPELVGVARSLIDAMLATFVDQSLTLAAVGTVCLLTAVSLRVLEPPALGAKLSERVGRTTD